MKAIEEVNGKVNEDFSDVADGAIAGENNEELFFEDDMSEEGRRNYLKLLRTATCT